MKYIIVVNGPPGVGKSSVCELLWKRNKDIVYIDLDELKWSINDYRKVKGSLQLTEKVAYMMMKEYLKEGLSVIMDKSFVKYEQVAPIVNYAKREKISYFIYNLEAPLKELKKRVEGRGIINIKHNRKIPDRKHDKIFDDHHKSKYEVNRTFDTTTYSIKKIVSMIEADIKNYS